MSRKKRISGVVGGGCGFLAREANLTMRMRSVRERGTKRVAEQPNCEKQARECRRQNATLIVAFPSAVVCGVVGLCFLSRK